MRRRQPIFTPTISVELKGGFGNQLFQFAAVLSAACKSNANFSFLHAKGTREFALDNLGLKLRTIYSPSISDGILTINEKQGFKNFWSEKYYEKGFGFSPLPEFKRSTTIFGYFQSFRYFEDISFELVNWINSALPRVNPTLNPDLLLHVRLGDIARIPHFRDFHGVTPSSYFIDSIDYLGGLGSNASVVTDDLDFLPLEHEELMKQYPELRLIHGDLISDFKLITSSKRLIISNSTFSWWGAYLSSAKIVAPAKWFTTTDLDFQSENFFPADWKLL